MKLTLYLIKISFNPIANRTDPGSTTFAYGNMIIYDPTQVDLTSNILLFYSKTCVKRPLSKRLKIVFQGQLLVNADQKYCRMLPLCRSKVEHSAILLTFIKLPFVIKTFVLSIFEWPFYTGFIVCK